MYYILGLDLATYVSGWSLLPASVNVIRPDQYGKIIHGENDDWIERVSPVLDKIDELFETNGLAIVGVAVEQLNSFRGGDVTRMLAGISGVVQYHLYSKHNIRANEIHTSSLKSAATKGMWAPSRPREKPSKQVVVACINQTFGLKLKFVKGKDSKHESDSDIADSIGAAKALRDEPEFSEMLLGLAKKQMGKK